jgi:hypothetical protein
MNDIFKNVSDIITSAAASPLSFISFLIIVLCVLSYFYFFISKQNISDKVLYFVLVGLIAVLIYYFLQPLCWNGYRSWSCPPPPPICWDKSHSNPCPLKPWIATRGVGADLKGNKVNFNIYFVTTEYSWEINTPNSANGIAGKIRRPDGQLEGLGFLENFLQSDDLKRVLNSADTIISFGTASCQGDDREASRALDRASLVQASIKKINKDRAISPIYNRLNLGRFKNTTNCGDSSSTASQRNIIVVGADFDKSNHENANMRESLKNFFENLEKKGTKLGKFNIKDYSLFEYMF